MEVISGRRIVLVEPNAALRSAIIDVLTAEFYAVEPCASLEQAVQRADGQSGTLLLVAWQSMQGLLADQHRHRLAALTRQVPVVLMVPRRWARMLDGADLGVAALVAKPFDADELLASVAQAMRASVSVEPAQPV